MRWAGTGPAGETGGTPGSSHALSLFAVQPHLAAAPENSARTPLRAARSQTGGGGNTVRQTRLLLI